MRTKQVYSYKGLWALAQTSQCWWKSKRRGTEEFSHSNAQHKGYSSANVCKHSSKHQRLKDFSCPAQVKAIFLEACHALSVGGRQGCSNKLDLKDPQLEAQIQRVMFKTVSPLERSRKLFLWPPEYLFFQRFPSSAWDSQGQQQKKFSLRSN